VALLVLENDPAAWVAYLGEMAHLLVREFNHALCKEAQS
jgi:hypothetical protein